MSTRDLLLQSFRMAVVIGTVLAVFVSVAPFWQMPNGLWLTLNNLLVVTSLILAAFVGYNNRGNRSSFRIMLLSIATFFSVIMLLYISSYALTTGFFAGKMVWIPFFYQDYTCHGSRSVSEYLNHDNNFRELLELQISSLLIGSVMYFTAGSLGYGVKAVVERRAMGRGESSV